MASSHIDDEDRTRLRRKDLEIRYIQVLESRVAELERRPILGAGAWGPPPGGPTPVPQGPGVDAEQLNLIDLNQSHAEDKTTETTNLTPPTDAATVEGNDSGDKEPKTETSNEDSKEESSQSRYNVVVNQLDPKTKEYVDVPLPKANHVEGTNSKHAFTFRKLHDEKQKQDGSEIEIDSAPLQKLIDKAVTSHGCSAGVSQLESPYMSLIWSWTFLEKEIIPQDGDDEGVSLARTDLKELLRLVRESSGDKMLDKYFKFRPIAGTEETARTVTFETLWTLFPPGQLVVALPFLRREQVFLVERYRETWDGNGFLVVTYSYDWDGHEFNRAVYRHTIQRFEGRKPLYELDVCPLEDYRSVHTTETNKKPEPEELRKRLVARGKRYHECCIGRQTFQYRKGSKAYVETDSRLFVNTVPLARRPVKNPEELSSAVVEMINGPVIVDFESFLTYQPHEQIVPTLGVLPRNRSEPLPDLEGTLKSHWDKNKGDKPLTDEQCLLLPPRVLGYCMQRKCWVQLDIEHLEKASEPDGTTFNDKLQLSKPNKDMIRGAVEAHDKKNVIDFIDSKGGGLVILLWGVPGVGKTLAAESVAQLAGKPLFNVSVSDIGVQGESVETNLKRVFTLAELWKTVLLFDEADVFLEARDTHKASLERNTIVSVLLKVLEYYNGILILTTNRLKSFDIAVQSRIHIAVEFQDLDQEQKATLFRTFIAQLRENNLVGEQAAIDAWVDDDGKYREVNGRQIRNIVSTAMLLAHADKRSLEKRDLVKVVMNTDAFKKALLKQEMHYRAQQTESGSRV